MPGQQRDGGFQANIDRMRVRERHTAQVMREHRGAMDADLVGGVGDRRFLRKIARQSTQPVIEPCETRPGVVDLIDRHRRKPKRYSGR